VRRWLRNYGFSLLVLAALAASAYFATTVPAPHPAPDFALRASIVYRLEVGAACFVAFYLAAMAFVLALNGRGFAEIGTRGLKAETVVRVADGEQQEALLEQARINQRAEENLERAEGILDDVAERLQAQEKRLKRLETERLT
jgi:hypothetical protein